VFKASTGSKSNVLSLLSLSLNSRLDKAKRGCSLGEKPRVLTDHFFAYIK